MFDKTGKVFIFNWPTDSHIFHVSFRLKLHQFWNLKLQL